MLNAQPAHDGFRHEAFLYEDDAQFVSEVAAFVSDGVERQNAVLVMLQQHKLEWIRKAVGPLARHIEFADMETLGANPARIIPAWQDFIDSHGDRPTRGVGEPIWASRCRYELAECHNHEALLNLAVDAGTPMWMVCPYDVTALDTIVIDHAKHNHPAISARQLGAGPNPDAFRDHRDIAASVLESPLPAAPVEAFERSFGAGDLAAVRAIVEGRASDAGLDRHRCSDIVLATNEVATNSVAYASGGGTLSIWSESDRLIVEIRDLGSIREPLIGRRLPPTDQIGGRGLWVANQVCNLVQIRSSVAGSIVRLHMKYT
jgi:anti-sigma regulatory factor (Ser/Thr protein kinase)